jgi:hypothetical protein
MPTPDSGSVEYSYRSDPNDGTKQHPVGLPENAHERYGSPISCSFTKSPNWVYINATPAANLGFFFGSSASYSEKLTSDYGGAGVGGATDGASADNLSSSAHYVNFGKPTVGTTLHIHPTAYSASKADVNSGIVTFVYASGLTPQRP